MSPTITHDLALTAEELAAERNFPNANVTVDGKQRLLATIDARDTEIERLRSAGKAVVEAMRDVQVQATPSRIKRWAEAQVALDDAVRSRTP